MIVFIVAEKQKIGVGLCLICGPLKKIELDIRKCKTYKKVVVSLMVRTKLFVIVKFVKLKNNPIQSYD